MKKLIYASIRKGGFTGRTIGPLMYILPEIVNPERRQIFAHERTHVRQFWRTLGVMPLLSMFSKRVRLKSEVEAYKNQIAAGEAIEFCAVQLSTKYGFADMSVSTAIGLLS